MKFRGQKINGDGWAYGWLIGDHQPFIITSFITTRWRNKTIIDGRISDAYEVVPETVGRETSLEDKNGKKIFEGDIVSMEFEDGEVCFAIEWDAAQAAYHGRGVGEIEGYHQNVSCLIAQEMIVVGNIYQDKHLLEDKK